MNKKDEIKIEVLSNIDDDIIEKQSIKRFELMNGGKAKFASKRKKAISIIALAATLAVLMSVFAFVIIPLLKPDEVSGTVPIYTGMTVSAPSGESLDIGLKPLSANGYGFGMMLLDNSNTDGNNGNHGANNPNKKPVEDIVNDSGTLAPTQSEKMYYAKQNEDIIITIHFENPDEYKIMSFKLNGKAYADYMFEYGSDYENIMIKVNVGEALGIVDYTIDAIQYADRDVLKYVEMKGDPTLSIGVYNENVPVPAITNEKIGTNSVSFDIDLPGENSLAALSGGKLYAIVADDTEIVKQQELKVGQTSVNFEGLTTGTAYRYAVIAEYDSLDGNGYKSYILTEKEFTTAEVITLENITPTENSVSFVLKWNEAFASSKPMTSFELYIGETKVKDIDFNATAVTDLISDTEYTIIAKYDNNGSTETVTYVFKTVARTVSYTVNHHIENLENTNYTLKETDDLTATENTDVTPNVNSYTGFTSPAKQTVKVLPDGSLVVDYYYTRNSYTITFITNGGDAIPSQTLKYEADILTLPSAVRGSDTFVGWFKHASLGTAFEDEKMGSSNLTLYAYWEGETKPGSFNYSGSSKISITKFVGSESDVVIPKYIGGKPVTELGPQPFYQTEVTSVIIPEGVTDIGKWALNSCPNLTRVTIPSTVINLGEVAFFGSERLAEVHISDMASFCRIKSEITTLQISGIFYDNNAALYLNGELVTDLVIPEGITSIEARAFGSLSTLKSVTIPDSVTSIGKEAFFGCPNISDVYITDLEAWLNISMGDTHSNPVTAQSTASATLHILDENGNEVTDIKIPESVKQIPEGRLYNCKNLKSVTVPSSVKSIGKEAFVGCSELTELIIEDGVTTIDERAFIGCTSLESVTIPNTVTSIGNGMFSGCTSLKSITIPDSVKSIGYRAFGNCRGLTSITIPDRVTSIGNYAFSGCTGLTSITIGKGVTSIGERAFEGCTGLTSIIIPDSVTSIGERAFYNCEELKNVYITDVEAWLNISLDVDTSLPNDYRTLHILDEKGNEVTELIIPEGVVTIRENAFYNCTELTSVTIPDSVTHIGDYAFNCCTGITSVTIPDSVTYIGDNAFSNCKELANIIIPDGVISIGDHAFSHCTELVSITIPDSVTHVGDYAFSGCTSLDSITISNGVTSIGDCAFGDCSKLTSIIIPDSVTSIGDHAFVNCIELVSVTVGNGVKSIGENAFNNCNQLTTITIGSAVNRIYQNAFVGCLSLTDIQFNGTKEDWGKITKYSDWNNDTGEYTVHCSDGDLTKEES